MALIGAYGFLLTGTTASGGGADTMDCRYAQNFGYLEYVSYSPSAILGFDVSKDGTGWMRMLTVTATTTTGTAQVSAATPYCRGVYITGWSTSASGVMFYAPGLQRAL